MVGTIHRILVTGGAGFIGSHTVDLLLEQPNIHVTVLDNLATGNIAQLNLFHSRLRFIEGDILNYGLLAREITYCDVVLHLAALPSVTESIAHPLTSFAVNTQGFLHVLEAIRESKRSIRLVYASSAAVYGGTPNLPCSDETPLPTHVLSPYALEKANNERYANLYAELFGIQSLGLRYFNVYGSRQAPNSPYSGVISTFLARYQQHEAITIFGDGKQSRDFIHVNDIARANLLAIQQDYCGVLNIARGVSENLLNLVSYIEKAGGYAATCHFELPRIGDIIASYGTTENAKRYLGYTASMKLADGIENLIAIKQSVNK